MWSEDEIAKIKTEFDSYIRRKNTPPLSACRGVIKKKTEKQIQDKVRTIIRQISRKSK